MQLLRPLYLWVITIGILFTACRKKDHTPPPSDHQIKTFIFSAAKNAELTTDVAGVIGADTIKVSLRKGINLTQLVPNITYEGADLSPASGVAQDFSAPVRYTVTAQDGSRHTYVVIVQYLSSEKAITSFQLRPQDNAGLTTTINGVITGDTIIVPYSESLPVNSLTPYITYTGVKLTPASGAKTDFSQPVVYTVIAEDASFKEYRVIFSPNKVLYIGSDDGSLYAMDATTGTLRWKFTTTGIIRSCPTLAAGTVYVGSGDGRLYALDSATGTVKWSKAFSQPVYSSPTVSGDAVYLYCAATLYSLDAATGGVKWQYLTHDYTTIVESPTVANGKVYVSTFNDFNLGAFDATTGTKLWSYPGGIGRANPAVADGVVYTGDEAYKMVALDANTGAVKWRYSDGNYGSGTSPTVADGKVFIGAFDGSIYAFDIATGARQWKFASNGIQYMGYQNASGITVGLWSAPVYANGKIFAGNNDGENYAINATTGTSTWIYGNTLSEHPAATQATVANGIVFYGTGTGLVVALDAATGSTKWTYQTKSAVYSGACVVGANGVVWHPGESGDTN